MKVLVRCDCDQSTIVRAQIGKMSLQPILLLCPQFTTAPTSRDTYITDNSIK